MLQDVLGARPDVAWSAAYLRARLAEHPAGGYVTWAQGVTRREAAAAGAR